MAKYDNQLNISCPGDLKRDFIAKAKARNTTATELICAFMQQYLDAEDTGLDLPLLSSLGTNNLGNEGIILEDLEHRLEVRLQSRLSDFITKQLDDRLGTYNLGELAA